MKRFRVDLVVTLHDETAEGLHAMTGMGDPPGPAAHGSMTFHIDAEHAWDALRALTDALKTMRDG
jgi:hypothetical protein